MSRRTSHDHSRIPAGGRGRPRHPRRGHAAQPHPPPEHRDQGRVQDDRVLRIRRRPGRHPDRRRAGRLLGSRRLRRPAGVALRDGPHRRLHGLPRSGEVGQPRPLRRRRRQPVVPGRSEGISEGHRPVGSTPDGAGQPIGIGLCRFEAQEQRASRPPGRSCQAKDGMSRALSGRVCKGPPQLRRAGRAGNQPWSVRRPRVAIVMGLDQHRAQITADWLNTETGEVSRARLTPAHRDGVGRFLARFAGQRLEVALEATTGWRFVVEELLAVGAEPHLAEPAEASALKGNKKRAKTDRGDARHLRELLMTGRLPESYIAPEHLLDLRARVRLRHALVDQRGEWQQRIHAVLYHHGHPQKAGLLTAANRAWLGQLALPAAAREQVSVALAMIDALDSQSAVITAELRRYARRQAGCRALMGLYGIGELTAVAILAELGDTRRFSSSRQAVRYAGLDITVHQSDQRRSPGHLSRQGPPALRWALYEAAQVARQERGPDREYYQATKERIGGNRACLSVARKLLKR